MSHSEANYLTGEWNPQSNGAKDADEWTPASPPRSVALADRQRKTPGHKKSKGQRARSSEGNANGLPAIEAKK